MKFAITADNGDSIRIEHTDGEILVRVDTSRGTSAAGWIPASAAQALAVAILAAVVAEVDQ